jgi:hypothetical protein
MITSEYIATLLQTPDILDLTQPLIRTSEAVYSVATRDNDVTFASYVNSIVLATVYAVSEDIKQDHAADMPTMTLYGTYVSLSR